MEIVKHTGDNVGGNFKLRVAYVEEVQEIPTPIDGTVHLEVTLKPGGRWYDIYSTEGTINFKDASQTSDHGDYFAKSLEAFAPKDSTELVDAANRFRNRPLIIDLIDNNGTRKLIGTIDEPMYVSTSFDSKTQVSERAGTALSFTGSGRLRSPIYNV
jgi:hypothetical protein